MQKRIAVGRGAQKADLVLKNAQALDVFSGTWVKGDIAIADGVIAGIGEEYSGEREIDCAGKHVVPGFIDSHIHIESTMMQPSEFAKAALPHGTTAAIWDPHEIANVFGMEGLEWAVDCAQTCPLDLFVMLSSCVPSSEFETSGASISAEQLKSLKNRNRVLGLAEMMNFPAILNGDIECLEKLEAFADMPKDGHSPLLRGKDLNAYIAAGIRTCHEVCSLEEAQEKMSKGMRVFVREGSVAKNAADLVPILNDYSSANCMLCTDDRNPLDISAEGHLDHILRIALDAGIRPEVAFRAASYSTALHYGLDDRGAVAPGYNADLVVLSDRQKVQIDHVIKNGAIVGDDKWQWPASPKPNRGNSINIKSQAILDKIKMDGGNNSSVEVEVIDVIPGQILTGHSKAKLEVRDGAVQANAEIQKIAIFERHHKLGSIGLGFVRGFNLSEGAIASTVAHDAHNIGAVGASDEAIQFAVDAICELEGGIVAVDGKGKILAQIPLRIAGLMSEESFEELIPKIKALRESVKALGCDLDEPFLQLSFLALPVIPNLKITDLGLIDVNQQKILSPIVAG